MVPINTHPPVTNSVHAIHQMMAGPVTPAPPAFFSPISFGPLHVQQNMPWQHLQTFQPPLAGPPPRRPVHRWDTLEHHKNNLHGSEKSHPQPLPGLSPPRSSSQVHTNMAETEGGNGIPDQMNVAVRGGDWSCTICGNQKNFANRVTCYRCNSPRQPHAQSAAGGRSKRCSGGKIISANVAEASEKLWKSPQHLSDILDNRQCPEGDQVAQMEHDRLLDQEKQFDSMFEKWEANFEQWKSDNENNPDWDYVQSHIEDMNKLREKMLNRREALSRKREQLLGMEFLMEGKNNCVDCQRWKV